MTLRKLLILSLALLVAGPMEAQKKKKRPRKPAVEVPKEDPRITNMREMTQQILFIDSIVADKEQVLAQIHLSEDAGQLMTSKSFTGKAVSGQAFVNEMGNKAYLSLPDDSLKQQLYTCDLLGGEWSQPEALQGLNDGLIETSYPYMLADGQTLYFAGQGEESIGGYDIFFTRYDAHSGRFLKPENLGMPFNSEANDYLYVIDEYRQLGYFVTDRRQPEGKVCIYIFVPAESRQTYDAGVYSEQQIRDFAAITRIADTWTDKKAREAAMARLKAVNSAQKRVKTVAPDAQQCLVITDALTYSTASDFKSKEAASLYQQLVQMRQKLSQLESQTEQLRTLYHQAGKAERKSLQTEIMEAEGELKALYATEKRLEKQTRQAEIKVIN